MRKKCISLSHINPEDSVPNSRQITNAGCNILRFGTIFLYELKNVPELLLGSEETLKSEAVSFEKFKTSPSPHRVLPSSVVNHAEAHVRER